VTERAHVILCDPVSPDGLPATGAGLARNGEQNRPEPDPDEDDGGEAGRTPVTRPVYRSHSPEPIPRICATGTASTGPARTAATHRIEAVEWVGAVGRVWRIEGAGCLGAAGRSSRTKAAGWVGGDGLTARTGIGLERLIRTADPSRVASGGGTARADRAVVVSRASDADRAGYNRAATGEVTA